nr:retrovirus-related Pol polyprotein from transposon TNT 1-94 [Tanacetum cinerariifolium]
MILEPGDANRKVTTILLGLPEDVYAAVDSCKTAEEIWLRVQQMMKGSVIGIQEKKAKLFNEWERFTSNEGESIESYYHHELKAERLAKTRDPLALMANSNNPYAFPAPHQDQSSFNQNYLQQPMPNPKDITDPTTAINMALALMAKAFKLNYSTLTNNNQRISSNPKNRQIAQPGMNMGQDRQMQMVRGNGGNQFRQYAGKNAGNLAGYNDVIGNQNQIRNGNLVAARAEGNAVGKNKNQIRCYNCRGVGHYARNYTVRPRRRDAAYLQTQLLIAQKKEAGIQLQAEEYDLMAAAADLDEIEEQASTSGTQSDSAPVYDSDGSTEVHKNYDENCDNNEIFNMLTQEEQYTELLELIPESHQVPQNDNDVIFKVTSVEQGDIGFFIGYSADSYAYRIYNRRTKKRMETMNVSFDELSAMAFKQRSSKPRLQSMTSGQISLGLDLTYAPSTITTQQPSEGELDLLFEAMYDDYFGGQPSATARTVPPVQEPQVHRTSTASTTIADTAPIPTNSSSHATNIPITSQDVDELNSNAMVDGNTTSMMKKNGHQKQVSSCRERVPPRGRNRFRRILRSGCSKHMTRNLKLLINFVWKFMGTVCFGKDHVAAILDLEVAFRRDACFVRNFEGVDLLKGDRSTNLYTINLHEMASASPICLMARASSTKSWLWHQRLSHLNFDTINNLARNDLVSGLPKFKYHKEHLCPSCEQGKSKRASHPPKPVPNSRQRLHLLHMDLCGPMRIASINGKRITVLLQSPVIIIRTDNGTDFKNQVLKEYFDSVGISHQMSYVRTPQQNGVVERRNRTLVEAARTMLIFSRAPLFLWAEAIATACFTQNCSITHRRFNKTPYEVINDRKPDILFLYVFGALCYPKNDREDIGKLGAKGDIGFFIGYSANSSAYKIYNRRTKKTMETMNVSFDELSAMAFEQRSSKPGLQFCDSDLEVAFRRDACFVRNFEGVDLLKGDRSTNLYTINLHEMASASPICLMARASSTKSWLWHQRLSHLNFDTINNLARNDLVSGLPKFKYHKEHLCPSCEQGKSKRASHPPKPVPNSRQRLHLLHMDLCGPMRIASINGKRIMVLLQSPVIIIRTDNGTDFKNQVLKEYFDSVGISHQMITVLLQSPVIIIRTDNGTDFKNQVLKEYFDSVGISHQMSYVRTPQQNGVVERRNRTLVEAARTMLIFSRAPLFLWAEAIATACFTQNCSITHRRFNKTPYEVINDRKPDILFLYVFGALCYPKNDREDIGKLGAKGDIGFFIGSGLDLTYAPSTITMQQPTEGELDLLFKAMYDDYIGGQPSTTARTVPPAQEPQVPALVDEFANRLTNVLPSTIAFELSSSTSCEVTGIFVARDDEFVEVGAVSAIVVDAIDD